MVLNHLLEVNLLLNLQRKNCELNLFKNELLEQKTLISPIFSGSKPDSIVNCYKEWKKAELGLAPNDTISREDLKNYKEQDEFDPKNMEGRDWENYI